LEKIDVVKAKTLETGFDRSENVLKEVLRPADEWFVSDLLFGSNQTG
jgi:hypothetical protein